MTPLASTAMQITLLPPILSTEAPTAVPLAALAFSPGMKVLATVLSSTPDGSALLSLGGRQVPSGGPLPYPAGTTLHLEVVEGGERPLLRLVASDPAATSTSATAAAAATAAAGIAEAGLAASAPPVSSVTYGLAAAVLAARAGGDVRAASVAVARWVPALVSAGVLSPSRAEGLLRALAPVPVPAPATTGTPASPSVTEAVARAIRERVADSGLLMERRLAEVVRHPGPDAERAAAGDMRARLAVLELVLQDAPDGWQGARTAVADLQEALLAEQARTAAHLARDGVVDLRIPLQVAGQDAEMRLRMRVARDGDDARDADPAPWRQVRLDLVLEGLGRVQVLLGLEGTQVRTEFVVERPEAADAIEAGLVHLGTSLEAAGFAQVLSRVVVDPVRACAPDVLPDLPPQRAILDTRA